MTERPPPALVNVPIVSGPELVLPRCDDFHLSGQGSAFAWTKAEWTPLTRVGVGKSSYATAAKFCYSSSGLYVLVRCEDRRLTCTLTRDGDDIYREDVIEIFVWPNPSHRVYLQYDLSPLGVELPLLVPNVDGAHFGWSPWHYEGPRRVRKAISILGGKAASMAGCTGWTAEVFLPFDLLVGLASPPHPGDRWRGNLYRVDFDELPPSHWAWCAQTGTATHAIDKYGVFTFGD
jgi:hypothetical protein